MSIDKSSQFIPVGKITTVITSAEVSQAKDGKIIIEDSFRPDDPDIGDIRLGPDFEDHHLGCESMFFEQVQLFKKTNGRLPAFNGPKGVEVYQKWEQDPEQNGYPNLRQIDEKYRPSEIRKLVLQCGEESRRRFDNTKGEWRTEIIAHEQGHLDFDFEFEGTPGIAADASYELLLKVSEYTKDKVFPEANELINLANKLNKERAKLLNIGETVAMFAEQDRCELDDETTRYSESFRVVTLLIDWVRDHTIEEYRQETYKIDEHDIGTLILLFGEKIVNPNSDALIDFQKIGEESSQKELLANGTITLDQAVTIAILDKAEKMLAGNEKLFIKKEERSRIKTTLKQFVPKEVERTAALTEELCVVAADENELRELANQKLEEIKKIRNQNRAMIK